MRYVILKKINNVWYATRNRYTAKELEVIIDKLYDDLKLETNTELEKGLNYLVGMPVLLMGIFTNIMSIDIALLLTFIWVMLVHFAIVPNMNNNKENKIELPENHKARGMM